MNTLSLQDKLLDRATEWLAQIQSGTLTAEQEQEFMNWLSASDEHQKAYIEVERQWQDLAIVKELAASAQVSTSESKSVVNPLWLRAMAASLLVFAVGLFSFVYLDYQGNRYVTHIGEQRQFFLDDGSRIHLNTDSIVQVDLDGQRRMVELKQGEVFFDVATDAKRPFVIKTQGGVVRVLGTRFNVQASLTGSEITVVEGKVSVSGVDSVSKASAADYQPVTVLVENQQLTLRGQPVKKVPAVVDASSSIAWRTGKLIYNGEPFATVLEDINRYYEGEIKIGEPELAQQEVVAILQLKDKKSIIRALEMSLNLASEEVSDNLTVLYPRK